MDSHYYTWLLAELAEKHDVPGAQLALYIDGTTYYAETGSERIDDGSSVSRESSFSFGSVTKAFTATVALQLVRDGDIDLDVPIAEYIPELGGGPDDIGGVVTMRALLSHTSGLQAEFAPGGATVASVRRYAHACRTLRLLYPPGTAFSYSNAGFVLAGHLIELMAGASWWDTVESLLLRPLNIEPAFGADPRVRPAKRPTATGHTLHAVRQRAIPIDSLEQACEAPASGLAGSAADLLKFGLAHIGAVSELTGVLDAAGMATMRQQVAGAHPYGLAAGWGLGLARFQAREEMWFGHDGTGDGTTCHLRFEPERRVVVAVTTNATAGLRLWDGLVRNFWETGLDIGSYSAPVISVDGSAAEASGCAGDYYNGDIRYAVRRGDDGGLQLEDDVPMNLRIGSDLVFTATNPAADEPPSVGRFMRDPATGRIDLMEINGRAARRRAGDVEVQRV